MSPTAAPPSLPELQRWLGWVLTDPRGPERALSSPEAPRPSLEDVLAAPPPLTPSTRLAVYADAYFLRLLESLAADFAALRRALGEESFRSLAADYLSRHPSRSPHIGNLGESLPAFLETHPLTGELGFLPDLARLEWTVLGCLFTDRLPRFDPTALQKRMPEDWDGIGVVLDPTVGLLHVRWPVERLWKRRAAPPGRGERVLRRPSERELLVYRDDEWTQVHRLTAPEARALRWFRDGRTLGEVCEELDRAGKTVSDVQSWFSAWIRAGVIKGIR